MPRWLTNSFAFRFLRGIGSLLRAGHMILSSRRIFLLSALPFFICLALYVVLIGAAVLLDRHLVGIIIGPGAWWRTVLRWALMVTIPLVVLVISVFTYTAVCFTAAAALYDWLAGAVEMRLTGKVEELPFSLKLVLLDNWRGLVNSLKILAITLAAWVVGLVAPPFTTALAILVSGVLLGLECCDYSMARRRMPFGEKLRFARRHVYEMLGLGLPLLFALTIPFVGAAFLPLGVVAGSILYIELRAAEGAAEG